MLFEIDHLTHYHYSTPVRLGEQLLRFLPRDCAAQQPLVEQVAIDPLPISRVAVRDEWDNRIERVRFADETDHLDIRVHLEVATLERPPAAWQGNLHLPIDYAEQAGAVAPYLLPLENPALLESFVRPMLVNSQAYAPDFLASLNQAIHAFYHCGVRLEGAAQRPAETLARGEGVCRDLTLLFMAACRQAGLAARFVSGYQQGDGFRQQRFLHAWAEVCLPGAGWLGYDPTHNAIVGGEHVAIAAAANQAATMPLQGGYTFAGATLTSTLDTDIRITTR